MQNLYGFYQKLLQWEGQKYCQLVHEWPSDLRDAIIEAFTGAVSVSSVNDSVCWLADGSTNQSVGNQVEKHCMKKLRVVIDGFSISDCTGGGYPDKLLTQNGTGLRIPLEVKATSDWNDRDSNRRVLTSSSVKIRQHFSPPIYHLLFTSLYKREHNSATINRIRLDFLEPTTTVNVRLEASVSHKILADSDHYATLI